MNRDRLSLLTAVLCSLALVAAFFMACVEPGPSPSKPDAPYDAASWHRASVTPGFDAAVPVR